MERQRSPSDLVRAYFACYESGDRAALEALLGDEFRFHSPHDLRLDRTAYFQKCWPNRKNIRVFHIEQVFEEGLEAFVRYECEPKIGATFRNTEFFRIEGNKIAEVEVYYGYLPKQIVGSHAASASSAASTDAGVIEHHDDDGGAVER
jgi:ketosteroid isomerase-like protein